jgi:hypothetical protein
MPWTKYNFVHTISSTGTTWNTTDNTPGGTQGGTNKTSEDKPLGQCNFEFDLAGTGASAVCAVEVRNGTGSWVNAATVTLSSASPNDSFEMYRAWDQYRFNTTTLSGTGVSLTVRVTAG